MPTGVALKLEVMPNQWKQLCSNIRSWQNFNGKNIQLVISAQRIWFYGLPGNMEEN